MPELKPVYLLTGSDRPKIETALARLRRHFPPEAVERLSAQELSGAEAVALCNAGSLFGGVRLVVIEAVDGRRGGEGRLTGGWKVADVTAVVEYLSNPSPGTVLTLVAEELKKDAPLAKACAKAGDVLAYEVTKRNLSQWIADRFAQRGTPAEPDACAALLHLVGEDPRALAAEIDKVAVWAAGEPVGESEIEQLVAPAADTPTFALTDAWARRDAAGALAASEAILEREGRPRRDTVPRLAGSLAGHVGRLRQIKRLAGEGVRAKEAAGRLRLHPFYTEKLFKQADGFSEDELRTALVRLAELDLALKGGSRLAPDLELQRALVDLSRPSTTALRG